MAAQNITAQGAITIDGMDESIKGLRKADKNLPKLVAKVSREIAKDPVAAKARKKWSAQRINSSKANKAITASGTARGAAINLRASAVPSAAAVEYGTHIHYVFGHPIPAREMKRRVFLPWRGNQFTVAPGASTGYVVQDAIRETLPIVERRFQAEVFDAVEKAVRSG